MIFITHRLPEVVALCDRATVLRDGRVAAELQRGRLRQRPHHLRDVRPAPAAPLSRATMRLPAQSHAAEGRASFRRGALRHSSRRSRRQLRAQRRRDSRHCRPARLRPKRAAGAIYGRFPPSGRILVEGATRRLHPRGPPAKPGSRFSPRTASGPACSSICPSARNITIGNLAAFRSGGIISRQKEENACASRHAGAEVKARSSAAAVSHLSGGNQQKLLFARVLMNAPKVLLLDEPTKGVDVATRHEIYRLIVDLADKASAWLSSPPSLKELIGLCDRNLVFDDGRIVDEMPSRPTPPRNVFCGRSRPPRRKRHAVPWRSG